MGMSLLIEPSAPCQQSAVSQHPISRILCNRKLTQQRSQQFTQQSALTPICRFGWLFEGVLSAESAQVLSQTMRILPTRDDQRGYVYLFEEIGGNGVPTGYYKIGKTTQNVENRRKQIQTGNLRKIDICFVISVPDCHAIEKDLHQRLSRYRIEANGGTEWFDFKTVDIKSVVNLMKGYVEPIAPSHCYDLSLAFGCAIAALVTIALLVFGWHNLDQKHQQQINNLIHKISN